MKTTEAEFDLFKAEFLYWIEKFGCMSWDVIFDWSDIGAEHDAEIRPDLEGRSVIVSLNTDVSREGQDGIKFLALHEALELLLTPLRRLAQSRDFSMEWLNSEAHVVVNTLIRLLSK